MAIQGSIGLESAKLLREGAPRQSRAAATLVAETVPFRAYGEVACRLAGLAATPFQSRHWLTAWLEIFAQDAAIEPFLVALRDGAGAVLLALPLIRRRDEGLVVLEHPDLGVSDYAAPLIDRARAESLPEWPVLWRLIRDALPPADLLCLHRLCPEVQGIPNPLHAHPRARRDRISGWVLPLPETVEAYRCALGRAQRDNLGKVRRRFDRHEGASAVMLGDLPEALAALDVLDRLQHCRNVEIGREYHLDRPAIAAFYRRLAETGLASGETAIGRLAAEGETVAVNFAVDAGQERAYLRIAGAYGPWARLSLGNIVTDLAIRDAIERGRRRFDFGMGDYEYKRRFGAREMPLHNLVLPLSARGVPAAFAWHARDRIARVNFVRRLTGRKPLPA